MTKSVYTAYQDGTLNPHEVQQAATDQAFGSSDMGFCVENGHKVKGVRPDEGPIKCPICHVVNTYGAEKLLLMGEGV